MSFTVFDISGHSDLVRGIFQRRLLEVRPWMFVGSVPARVRDDLWAVLVSEQGVRSSAVLLYPSATTESGFLVRTLGDNRRQPVNSDGIPLIKYLKFFGVSDSSKVGSNKES